MTLNKILFIILLLAINIIAITMIGLSFLGASNANGEGRPMISETEAFFHLFLYSFVISIIFSGLTYLLANVFRHVVNLVIWNNKHLLLIQLAFLISIFLYIYLYLTISFTLLKFIPFNQQNL